MSSGAASAENANLLCPRDVPSFSDYPVSSVWHGRAAAVDLSSSPGARRFRTQYRLQAPSGPNFAGRLTVVHWGCGAPCISFGIVDAPTGRIVASNETGSGPEFR